MSLNPLYITAPSLQEYFVDKDTGEPLAGGYVYFYRDNDRAVPKSVYELEGNASNYTYEALPNPIILSAVGTIQDQSGFDVIPYYYPYDNEGNEDLYYIQVFNANGVPQFTRQGWPNPNSGLEPTANDLINYIPNGQFLSHTNPPDNELVGGTNLIAQGGWSFELPETVHSINTLEFVVQQLPPVIPQAPRYIAKVTCSMFSGLDTIKSLRIKWNDVNKFSTQASNVYTFAFWGESNINLNVNVAVVKYFGATGSVVPVEIQDSITLTPSGFFYNLTVDFGNNEGYSVDLEDQTDFVAIDIQLPVDFAFVAEFTDFVLVYGDTIVENFPVETNALMISGGVFGWTDVPDGMGGDLYLPPILTPYGMTWDTGSVGDIGMSVMPIPSPTGSPVLTNKMPCDGATYVTADYASNGRPFSALANFLYLSPPDLPLYGTGPNFVSALIPFSGVVNPTGNPGFRLVYNTAGTASTIAADGGQATGFNFGPTYVYNGANSTAGFNLFASNTAANTVWAVVTNGAVFDVPTGPGDTGFTMTNISGATSALAFQDAAYSIVTVPASAFPSTGTGAHFAIKLTGGTQQNFWFNVGFGNTPPTDTGQLNQINVNAAYSAQDVADAVRDAINGFTSTSIGISAVPTVGTGGAAPYFTFTANPASINNFYVYYVIDGVGVDPMLAGYVGIKVQITSSYSPTQIRDASRAAINRYQFQSPDFRGMFLRCSDPNSTWDTGAANRWSYTSEISGTDPGTYEYSQFLSHNHVETPRIIIAGPTHSGLSSGSTVGEVSQSTANSGGGETRPVNTTIFPYIRY
jgi:hypothetical protein